MRKLVLAGLALSALFAVSPRPAAADVWYPWCGVGESRVVGCFFTSREQCAASTRWQGGGSCIENFRPRGVMASAAPATLRHHRVARVKLHRGTLDD